MWSLLAVPVTFKSWVEFTHNRTLPWNTDPISQSKIALIWELFEKLYLSSGAAIALNFSAVQRNYSYLIICLDNSYKSHYH